MRPIVAGILALILLVTGGCGSDSESAETTTGESAGTAPVQARLDAIGAAVDSWEAAGSLGEAQAAADEARSLVIGSDDEPGLLPNRTGNPGVASGLANCAAQATHNESLVGPPSPLTATPSTMPTSLLGTPSFT